MASSCIYRDLLLKKRHGLPLWTPDPADNLEEHRKQGISIGDLGILTDDGGFRYLFNIHAEADAPINLEKGTPQSFTPLPMPTITQRGFFHVEKACLTENASVEMGVSSGTQANALVAGVGVDLTFTITHERAAMLYLPHGADREDTDGIRSYKEYAIQHGDSWYKFVNEELKSDARNGSLYLVTGCDKSGSWALGAGSPRQGSSFKFAIQGSSAVVPASVTADFHVAWTNTSGIEGRHHPSSMKHTVDVKNQCVFVRGISIAIRKNWFTKPWLPASKVDIKEVNTSTVSFSVVNNNVPFQSAAKQNSTFLKAPPPPQDSVDESRSGDFDQEHNAIIFYDHGDTSGVIVEDYPEQPKPVLSPGSYICEHLLFTRPDINLVIVHDNDWMTVTSSDDENVFTSDGTDYERLTTHVLQKCQLQVTQGMTLLLRRPYQDLATIIEGAIPDLLSALKDVDQVVRMAAASLMGEFSKQSHLSTAVKDAIAKPVGLLKEEESDLGSTGASAIRVNSSQPRLVKGVEDAVVDLPDSPKKNESDQQYAAALATSDFSMNQPLDIISKKRGVMSAFDALKNEHSHVRVTAVSVIAGFSKQPDLVMNIKEGIPDVLKLLKDKNNEVRGAAVLAIAELLKQSDLVMAIKEGIPDVFKLLKVTDYNVHTTAVSVITELSKQPDLVMAIKEGIPDLLELLKVTDDDVRRAAVSVIVEFSKQPDLVVAIKEGIPLVLDLLKDTNYYVRRAAVSAITDLLKQPDLAITIKDGIPDVLTHVNFDIRWAAGSVIAEISKQSDLIMDIKDGIPDLLNLLKDKHSDVRKLAVSAIAECSKKSDLIMAIEKGIPDILNLLTDKNSEVRKAAVLAITDFSKQRDLIMTIEMSIPDIFRLLKDKYLDIREAATKAISELSKHADLVVAIESAMPILMTSLVQGDSDVRVATISVIHALYKQCIISM